MMPMFINCISSMENKITRAMALCVIISVVVISCTQRSTKFVKINYIVDNEIKQRTDAILIYKEVNGRVIYSYYDSIVSDTSMILEIVQLKDKTYIEFNKVRCNKIGEIQYSVEGNTWKISKYLFDKNDVQDEELVLFFNELYGVIVEYNKPWSICSTYESDSCSAILIDNILKDELDLSGTKLPEPTGEMN